ncbi:PTS sugar transporter subunit IIA [Alkalibaculum sp. M08DMB]|uniref:PTS sugar transporter subunit IIA n=1 Tax=Alkalibaculum sporogenes TaxID=2655001 RepID=A0A6A7K449_9FIRM|nr:PTS sugar transporter subunit IIA [Alkalibaculum sporogenes]MPW24232.1 PTS sugar transporter subunit IIA [Alkalibaculum sporogenes]
MHAKIFDPDLIFSDIDIKDKDQLLDFIASKMYQLNYVKESYIQAVVEREKNFPTGIQTQQYGIAIPHTDIIHVNKPIVAVCILSNPIIFKAMGMPEEEVPVKFVFMLSIDDPNNHIELLSKLSILFQDKNIMTEVSVLSRDKIFKSLNYYMNR